MSVSLVKTYVTHAAPFLHLSSMVEHRDAGGSLYGYGVGCSCGWSFDDCSSRTVYSEKLAHATDVRNAGGRAL
jgi:hypothetical protein